MWVCKKCNEENEDNFDSCWKCQTFSEKGAEKSIDHQKQVEAKWKEKEKSKETETQLEDKVKKYRIILWLAALITWFFSLLIFLFFHGSFFHWYVWGGYLSFFLAYFPSAFVYYSLKKYFKRKILKKQEKE